MSYTYILHHCQLCDILTIINLHHRMNFCLCVCGWVGVWVCVTETEKERERERENISEKRYVQYT